MPNRLINENSPYLLQHAQNPVDWYSWGEEALEKARREEKPIFLSIGYAACHWCHVMAHESFENADIAALLNANFISIKVDREERPDIDEIYMDAVVAMTGQGGWPLSVFLTPQGEPFFGGTYFPPTPRYNLPSFREVLQVVHRVWTTERAQINQSSKQIADHLRKAIPVFRQTHKLSKEGLDRAVMSLAQAYDWKNGGWGHAPKFPQSMTIEFLLHRASEGDQLAMDMANHALHAMARGGMYDLLGGGFARYSTDEEWKVPHFEKMLYDNALLARVYLHAYLLTRDERFRQVCEDTLSFMKRELSHPSGGFFSSLDADSEGEEGKYYLWNAADIRQALPSDESELAIAAYGIAPEGNHILRKVLSDVELSGMFAIPLEKLPAHLESILTHLRKARQTRVRPSVDGKVLTGWNALSLVAFSEAARYLGSSDYFEMAMRNANFLLSELYSSECLFRSWRNGKVNQVGFLEDYAGLILGLLSLYQSDPKPRWFQSALQLTEDMFSLFSDPSGGFFDTCKDQTDIIYRPKMIQDNATPCGNSLAALALIQMSAYTGEDRYRQQAETMLASVEELAIRYPTSFSNWLCAIYQAIVGPLEVAILGELQSKDAQNLITALWLEYRPYVVSAFASLPLPSGVPALLHERGLLNSRATAYVCRNFVCNQPTNDPNELIRLLRGTR